MSDRSASARAAWAKRRDEGFRAALAQPDPGLDVERLRRKLHQMANVAAEKRPMSDVARGYERACDELLEWIAAEYAATGAPE